jgi:metal-dependent amidase/aminoacylase/carboxypeptidase family protein
VAIGLLRQQMAPGQLAHGIVTDGGSAANVIPGRTQLQYTMRAVEAEALRALENRMLDCFAAGAVASGCDHEVQQAGPPYAELRPDGWMSGEFRREMVRMGRSPVPAEVEAAMPLGSTDMGNVTQLIPGIHPVVGIDAGGAVLHQPGFAAASVGASGDRAVVEGALMLARVVVRLAETPEERNRVLELRDGRLAS